MIGSPANWMDEPRITCLLWFSNIAYLFIYFYFLILCAEFEDDPDIYVLKPIKYVGIEVWQVGFSWVWFLTESYILILSNMKDNIVQHLHSIFQKNSLLLVIFIYANLYFLGMVWVAVQVLDLFVFQRVSLYWSVQ